MKNSFILYTSYKEQVDLLSDEQAGVLFKAILNYANEEELPDMDGITKIAFAFIHSQMDKDAQKYNEICEKRRDAGKHGGRPKANGSSEKQKKQMVSGKSKKSKSPPDNDNEYDNDNDNVNESDKDISLTESNDSVCQTEVRQVLEAWNTLNICPVKRINSQSQRYKMLTARLREYGIDDVLKAIDQVKASDFLKGGNSKGWTITFDWFVRPNNFPKVLEGNYSNKTKAKHNENQTINKNMSYSEWRILHNG